MHGNFYGLAILHDESYILPKIAKTGVQTAGKRFHVHTLMGLIARLPTDLLITRSAMLLLAAGWLPG